MAIRRAIRQRRMRRISVMIYSQSLPFGNVVMSNPGMVCTFGTVASYIRDCGHSFDSDHSF